MVDESALEDDETARVDPDGLDVAGGYDTPAGATQAPAVRGTRASQCPRRGRRRPLRVAMTPQCSLRALGLFCWSSEEDGQMMKVEAVVVRDRVETVMEAVEAATGHVGVTVIEAVGHGREKGITHEYRGRVFESRFLPKALMTFVVADDIAETVHRRDRRRRPHGPRQRRRHLLGVAGQQRHPQPNRSEARGGRGGMSSQGSRIRSQHDLGRSSRRSS